MSQDPNPAQWFCDQLPDGIVDKLHVALVPELAVRRADGLPPEQSLIHWHNLLASEKSTLRQSEISFIDTARRAGWSDDRITDSLGVARGTLDQHYHQLQHDSVIRHPSQDPTPWTGGDWATR